MKYFSPDNKNNPNGDWVRSKIDSELSNDQFFQDFSRHSIEKRGSSFSKKKTNYSCRCIKKSILRMGRK
jgi:hypothetical protein